MFDRLPQKRGPKKDDVKSPRYKPYTINSPNEGSRQTKPQDGSFMETKFTFHNFQQQRQPVPQIAPTFFANNQPPVPNMQYQFRPDHNINQIPLSPNSQLSNVRMNTPQPSLADKYFDNLYLHSPSVDRMKALAVYASKHGIQNDPNFPRATNEDFALFYAMQTYYYKRNQNRILAQKCFEMSRDYIGGNYDRVIQNYDLATAFVYLGLYLIDECEMERASFYIESVQGYLKRTKTRHIQENPTEIQIRSLRDRLLRVLCGTGLYLCSYAIDMSRVVKSILCACFIAKQYGNAIALADRQLKGEIVEHPADMDELLRYLDVIVDDLDSGSNSFKIDLYIIDRLTTKFQATLNNITQDSEMYMRHAQVVIIAQGAKIQLLHRQDRYTDETARQAADTIISMTVGGPFPIHTWNQIIAQPLSLAISTHLRCIEACKNIDEKMKLALQVKHGVLSMKILGDRYRIAMIMYGTLLSNAEERVAMCEEEYRRRTDVPAPQVPAVSTVTTPEAPAGTSTAPTTTTVKEQPHEQPEQDLKLQRFLAEIDPAKAFDQVVFF
jgi:hypothetical protein